jgi:hypothetical protein
LPQSSKFAATNKKPAEPDCFSGLESFDLAGTLAGHPRRRAMRVVMMVMTVGPHIKNLS